MARDSIQEAARYLHFIVITVQGPQPIALIGQHEKACAILVHKMLRMLLIDAQLTGRGGAAKAPALVNYNGGRIFLRGASLMSGYFGNAEASREVLSADGWLDTGDLGYLADGEIVPTGRAKDLILLNGRNVWPQDLEWSAESEVERLRSGDVAAFSVDQDAGETLVVLVQARSSDPAVRQAALVFVNIPFALIGGVVALAACGEFLSVPASVGFIALWGIAVLNGVVLVSYIRSLREGGMSVKDAVLEGARQRFRPVMMTATVAMLGLIPFLISDGPGSEVQRPLAIVVIGGLITCTLLTLVVVPTIYHWFDEAEPEA